MALGRPFAAKRALSYEGRVRYWYRPSPAHSRAEELAGGSLVRYAQVDVDGNGVAFVELVEEMRKRDPPALEAGLLFALICALEWILRPKSSVFSFSLIDWEGTTAEDKLAEQILSELVAHGLLFDLL